MRNRFIYEESEVFAEEQAAEFNFDDNFYGWTVREKVSSSEWLLINDDLLFYLTPEEEFIIAEGTDTSEYNLDILADTTELEEVRTAIARNVNTGSPTLHLLSQICGSLETVDAIIENPATSAETLIAIVYDENVPLELKEKIVNHYRFEEVVDDLMINYEVNFDSLPESWRTVLKEREEN